MTPKLIILDMDNTIYDYDSANNTAVASMINYCTLIMNGRYTFDDLFAKYKNAKLYINDKFSHTAMAHDKTLQIKHFIQNLDGLDNCIKLELIINCKNIYYDTLLSEATVYNQLYAFLDRCLELNIKVAILTNNTLDIQLKLIEKFKLDSYIDNVYSSYEIGFEKPNAKCFQYVIDHCGIEPHDCVMVGDSYADDVQGAENCGIRAILFKHSVKSMNYCSLFDLL